MSTDVFAFLDSISHNKKDIMDEFNEKDYAPFVVNRFLSGSLDALFYVNELNQIPNLDKRMQYDFLRFALRKNKRYNKWVKKEKSDLVDEIMEYYGYSRKRAEEIAPILTGEEIDLIRERNTKGGAEKGRASRTGVSKARSDDKRVTTGARGHTANSNGHKERDEADKEQASNTHALFA